MNIIKELPEIFEEFAEQKKQSFLIVKECKDRHIPVIGAYCSYFPRDRAVFIVGGDGKDCGDSTA